MTLGVLLTNLGTPDAPTPKAVREYLREFLSDPRVVEIPRIFWKIILYGFVLPFRSRRSAKLYQKIWTKAGSPLKVISMEQVKKLQDTLGSNYKVILGMRYASPSLHSALEAFKKLNIHKIIVLPLYPQYSSSTTGSTIDKINELIKTYRVQPDMRVIREYYDNPAYISAIVNTLKNNTAEKILFSFHGLPQKYIDNGDVYYEHCQKTVELIIKQLSLTPEQFEISFQSRLGRTPWIQPYTDYSLKKWAEEGVKRVTVICPGFATDCLETLEEINIQNRQLFLDAGGEEFNYIPALNTSGDHIELLSSLIKKNTENWL